MHPQHRFAEFIADRVWTFAKTMPQWPHEYTVRRRNEEDPEFCFAVLLIRQTGMKLRFKPTNSRFVYLPQGPHMYWTMGWPLDRTIILNRCLYDPALPDHLPVKTRAPKASKA